MTDMDIVVSETSGPLELEDLGLGLLPRIILEAGPGAQKAFVEYFCVTIRNKNTRMAYGRQVWAFLGWCEDRGLNFQEITPMVVAGYIENFEGSIPSEKQALAAIRKCFDWLVVHHILRTNPATSVKGSTYSVRRGKTPVLSQEQLVQLIESIDPTKKIGLRDRALIGAMYFSFGRVSAVADMKLEDYYPEGKRWMFRLREKGGHLHAVPVHHKQIEYLDAFLEVAGERDKREPLFPTVDRRGFLTDRKMSRVDVFRMLKRRAKQAGLPVQTCCHTFRATGITEYIRAGGTVEGAQKIANHADPRTTKLYDHSGDDVTLDEIERIPSV